MSIKKFWRWGFLPVLAVLVFSSGAGALEEAAHLTLKESIDLALTRSLAISSAREGVRGAESARKEARTSFLPTLNANYSYTRLNETPETSVFDPLIPGYRRIQAGTRDNYVWGFEVMQPLFTGGSIANAYKIAKLGVDVSRALQSTTAQDIVLQVKDGYFNILKAERVLEVARQSVAQLRAHRDIAQSFFDVGIIPKNDLLYAEVELAGGMQNLVAAENALELAKARFNTTLRRSIDAPVEVEDILSYQAFEKELDACLKIAFERRPEISLYELQVQQSDRAVDLARSGYYPKVSLVGNYSRYGDDPGVSGGPYLEEEDWYVMAVADWNFWEWGKTKHSVDASKSKSIQAQNDLANVKELIALEVKNAYLALHDAEKRIFVAEKAIVQAEENFRINEERYREQVGTTTDVIDAQTLLTKTKSDYYNALSNYNIAWGRLERSMGIVYEEPKVMDNE